jgi:hypothetical protein
MVTLFEELIVRLRWQPECVEALRTQLARHPDVAARLRDALAQPPSPREAGNPSLEPLDGWLRQ